MPDADVVGREEELAAVERFVRRVSEGPVGLLLEGEMGIGKTTLWQATVERAIANSCRVLACRPAESEAKLSFAALADLFDPVVDDVLADLPEPQRRALGVALLRESTEGDARHSSALGVALVSVLSVLAAEAPVVLAIDDTQWLDGPSSRMLEFALRRITGRRIGVVAVRRFGAEHGAPFNLERFWPEDRLERVVIGPLSLAALHRLLKVRLQCSIPRPVLVKIADVSRGNPFYALEIARALARAVEIAAPHRVPVPDDVRVLVTGRLRRLPANTKEVLVKAAALSQPSLEFLDAEASFRRWMRASSASAPAAASRSSTPYLRRRSTTWLRHRSGGGSTASSVNV